ncbi:MAG: hypothetical protein QNJ94_07790 [Alphaproteobacteria bacterium]|nr:hypothetical protein [Alphaproteobacteria bacterium]
MAIYEFDHRDPLKTDDPSVHQNILGKAAVFCGLFAIFFYPLILAPAGIALGLVCLLRKDVGFGLLAVIMGAIPLILELARRFG